MIMNEFFFYSATLFWLMVLVSLEVVTNVV